jgi:hypothetical protein
MGKKTEIKENRNKYSKDGQGFLFKPWLGYIVFLSHMPEPFLN